MYQLFNIGMCDYEFTLAQEVLHDIDMFVEEVSSQSNIILRVNGKVFDKIFMNKPPKEIKYPLVLETACVLNKNNKFNVSKNIKTLLFKKNNIQSCVKERMLIYDLCDVVIE
jgi:hypothetical protein